MERRERGAMETGNMRETDKGNEREWREGRGNFNREKEG